MMQHLRIVFATQFWRKFNHVKIYLSLFFIIALLLRSLSINKDGLNLLYCDEAVYQNELARIIAQGRFTTTNFLSGGLNFILFVPFFKIISVFDSSISNDQILLTARLLFPIILSSSTVFLIYKLTKLLTKNKKTPLFASFLYAIAAYPISQSHIYYPDSYAVFFGTLIMYSIIKYSLSQQSKVLLMAFTLSLGLSIKYTFVCYIFTAAIAILIKSLTNRVRIIDVINTILTLILQTIAIFAIINYSIFFDPFNFFFDFAANIANYNRPVADSISTYEFYSLSLILIPLGLSGLILLFIGIYFTKKQILFRANTLILVSPVLIFLIFMNSGNLGSVRNINMLLYLPFIFFAFAITKISEIKSSFGAYVAILIIIIIASQSVYLSAQTLRKDARIQAAEWINNNVPYTEIIGTNPGCGYKFPLNRNYKLGFDQDMKSNYNYYVFDMNWYNTVFYSEYSKNSWYLEFNPSYISFYHWHNLLPSKIFEFQGTKRNIQKHIPKGYEFKVFKGYGPDVIILKRI
jgi:4-amino-4-deoxy-L-arabinose transferase-like glycosyltransferase